MTTLIAKYLAKPTAANAAKIADYHRKHMTPNGPAAMTTKTGPSAMAECLLAGDYLALAILREALEVAKAV